jgi:hypothetical protein
MWKKVSAGDLTYQLSMKKKMNCKSFKYFVDEIAPGILKVNLYLSQITVGNNFLSLSPPAYPYCFCHLAFEESKCCCCSTHLGNNIMIDSYKNLSRIQTQATDTHANFNETVATNATHTKTNTLPATWLMCYQSKTHLGTRGPILSKYYSSVQRYLYWNLINHLPLSPCSLEPSISNGLQFRRALHSRITITKGHPIERIFFPTMIFILYLCLLNTFYL